MEDVKQGTMQDLKHVEILCPSRTNSLETYFVYFFLNRKLDPTFVWMFFVGELFAD